MIVEYIRYKIPESRHKEFEAAYDKAQASLKASSHCLSYEVSHGIEEPDNYVVRIEWDSEEGHMKGFRTSPEFQTFFAAVRPFFNEIQEMKHYAITDTRHRK
jgi:quinol monooxygenase YgiN